MRRSYLTLNKGTNLPELVEESYSLRAGCMGPSARIEREPQDDRVRA